MVLHHSHQPVIVRRLIRYLSSCAGVALVTFLISLLLPHYRVANISMVYLLLVLALAVFAGSGPAIVASVLAFLAFDWFFVQPLRQFTVTDPEEWLALFLFLVVAIITGQLAAGLRRRAEEARQREREMSTLYELSIQILADARSGHVLGVIADRLRTAIGADCATIFIRDAAGQLDLVARAGTLPAEPEWRDIVAGAIWGMDADTITGRYALQGASRITRDLTADTDGRDDGANRLLAMFAPLVLGDEHLGVIAVVPGAPGRAPHGGGLRLLHAFAAQSALAVGRSRLVREEERARSAAESERMKSAFLAAVSHDLRTPLTAIRTAAATLGHERGHITEAEQRELATSIDQEAMRLNRLVENVLEISRIESGALPLHRQPEDLSEVIGGTIHRLAHMLTGHEVEVEVPDSLPLLFLDAVQIDRVLVNLLENAAKFAPPGSPIDVRVWRTDDQVAVAIHNTGSFIPADEHERIFDKFYRLASGTGNRTGTGLGLAICRGIIEAHGGSIRAESDACGVRFVFCLPMQAVPTQHGATQFSEHVRP